MSNIDTVRAAFAAYVTQDAEAARPLYSADFTFTSPQDDGLDKDAFFARCFPTAARLRRQEVLQIAEIGADGVFLLYEYELIAGGTHRNAEFLTLREALITEVQVFFGGKVQT